jgi:glycosyltransferase involved in cell wall biosynthesis
VSRARVLVLVENLSVPFDRRVWQESQALNRAGYQVVVICPRGYDRDRERHVVIDSIEIHRFDQTAASHALGYPREYSRAAWDMGRLIRRLAREKPFDVVHACNPPDFLLALARPLRRRGARFVFDHHDLVPELYRSRVGRRDPGYVLFRGLERLAFTLADVVVTTNESYRRVALERGNKDPERVFVVRNAPDPNRFPPIGPDATLKRGRAHLIAYLGLMGRQDGVDIAIRALAHLRDERDDWYAIFMGDGDILPDLRRQTAALALDERIDFTGRADDELIARVLSTADVCLSPEPPSPLNDVSTLTKVVEYMTMGCPIVAFDLSETRVSAGRAAVYAQDGASEYARCIAFLLDDPARRTEMARVGRERAHGALSWTVSERQLLAAYELALSGRSPR